MVRAVGLPLLAASLAAAVQAPFQVHVHPWDSPPSPDATGHLIFQALGGLLQLRSNTRHPNGHSIVPATIAPGTVLYHGRVDENPPTGHEWLAVDPEHSYNFALGDNGHHMSFISTRQLNLLYFDGSSASKTSTGTMDMMDMLIWGEVSNGKAWREYERLEKGCEWAKLYNIDGFLRMYPDFEIMYCNFTQGLKLVSNINVLSGPGRQGGQALHSQLRGAPPPDGGRRRLPVTPPSGWIGSLPTVNSLLFEFVHAGLWHSFAPGESRVHLDLSSMITFYDPSLTSLVASRRIQSRDQYRVGNISSSDFARVQSDLADALKRDKRGGSGVDWRGIVQVIMDRYSDRLPLLQYILRPSQNATTQAAQFRSQLLIMLSPYISRTSVPEQDRSWVETIAGNCASPFTSGISNDVLTPQEGVLRDAIDETLREICRVLSLMWADAFAIEEQEENTKVVQLLEKWTGDVNGLMSRLDWSVWLICIPACGPETICYLPEWPWNRPRDSPDGPVDVTPRCIPRLPPYTGMPWEE